MPDWVSDRENDVMAAYLCILKYKLHVFLIKNICSHKELVFYFDTFSEDVLAFCV